LPSEVEGGLRLTVSGMDIWDGVYAHIALSEEMTPGGLPKGGWDETNLKQKYMNFS